MESPIYGDENSKAKNIIFIVIICVLCAILFFTVFMLALFGLLNSQWINFAFALFLISIIIPEIFLLYWHKFSYVEPKVKIITIMLPAILVAGCFVAFLYIFFYNYDGKGCRRMSSKLAPTIFNYETGDCIPLQGYDSTRFAMPNTCVVFGSQADAESPFGSIVRYAYYNSTSGKCQ